MSSLLGPGMDTCAKICVVLLLKGTTGMKQTTGPNASEVFLLQPYTFLLVRQMLYMSHMPGETSEPFLV